MDTPRAQKAKGRAEQTRSVKEVPPVPASDKVKGKLFKDCKRQLSSQHEELQSYIFRIPRLFFWLTPSARACVCL